MAENVVDDRISEEDSMKGKYLTFSLEKEEYGIEIRNVRDIVEIQNITVIPELPNYMKGVINLRGTVIPIMDMRLRFCIEEREYNDRTCIIIVNINGMLIGLIVDSVQEVIDISDEDIVPPPSVKSGYTSNFISGIGKTESGIKLLIDCEKIFSEDSLEEIENLMV